MRHTHHINKALLCCYLIFCHLYVSAQTVITNSSVNTTELNIKQLRAIFSLAKQNWQDRQAVKVVVMSSKHKTHISFSRKILNVFPYQLKRNWDRLSFSGMSLPPIEVTNQQEMLEQVNKIPGSIGYIEDASLANGYEGVKIVQIN